MKYRFSLEKGSKKFPCPSCQKQRFVRYVDNETNAYADHQFGRCDREQECGYHQAPYNGTINTFSYFTDNKPTQKISFIAPDKVEATLKSYETNTLKEFLKTHYNERMVDEVLYRYKVGTSKLYGGSPIFWQADSSRKIRSGKIMGYNSISGKRVKEDGKPPQITYYHSLTESNDYNYSQCMFGAHLINENDQQYGVVESEKTALIMSLEMPEYIWISVNGVGGFKESMLQPLKGKKIVAFPDKGCYFKWKEPAESLNQIGYNIKVSEILEEIDLDDGADISDIFLHQLGV